MQTDFLRQVPLISIAGPMVLSMVYPVLHDRKICRRASLVLYTIIAVLNALLIGYLQNLPAHYFTYAAGYFPAPWGNELRAGMVEAVLALAFTITTILSIWGDYESTFELLPKKKNYIHYIMLNFLLASVIALTYTNDLFTAYVFIEINTITACGIMIPRHDGKSLAACMKYLVMSMVGSGLYLFSICYIYGITGQLLMVPAGEAIKNLVATGQYRVPLIASLAIMGLAIAVKAGLFPFHAWFPDAYANAPHSSSALLSGIVSKAYIFVFIKIIFRVYGTATFELFHLNQFYYILGCIAMLIGSVFAFMQDDIKKMVSFSSVAQIGYIFMGFGINTKLGYAAACFHIIFHAFTKAMLFVSTGNLVEKAGKSKISDMRGMGYKCPMSAITFWVGGLSMIGIPLFMGFISKLNFASAAFSSGHIIVLVVLGLSTCLNVLYFIPPMTILYSKRGLTREETAREHESFNISIPLICFIAVNIILGLFQSPVMNAIMTGLETLG
ncbi:MAG: sodium:proton antiporter [Clostridia bacterium]|nr:sodium:proton antiporter [Clostridia bacterium]